MRALGIDYGDARVGIAITDPLGYTAQGLETIHHQGNDKIVLNMSFVNDADKADFEYELKCKIFDIIPPINDRNKNNESVNDVLYKLGFKNVKTM